MLRSDQGVKTPEYTENICHGGSMVSKKLSLSRETASIGYMLAYDLWLATFRCSPMIAAYLERGDLNR